MTNVATTAKLDRRAQLQKERQESYALLAVNVTEEPDDADDECVDKLQASRELSSAAVSAIFKRNLEESTIINNNDCHHVNLSKACIGNQRLEPKTSSGFNTSTVSDLTDSSICSLGGSLSGFGLDSISEMGWNSFSDGLGSILKRNDENAVVSTVGSDAIQHRKTSDFAPASSRMRSNRLSATPAQIAAAVNLIREQDERRLGRVSITSSSRSLNMSLNDIESYVKRNSLATVRNGNSSGQHSDETFEELRKLMGNDAFILDVSDCEEDDEDCVWSGLKIDSNSRMGNHMTVDFFAGRMDSLSIAHGMEQKNELDLLTRYCCSMRDSISIAHEKGFTTQRESATMVDPFAGEVVAGENSSDDDSRKNNTNARLGIWGLKRENKQKSIISLSPMCRIGMALNEMFGDEVGPRW